MIPAFILTSQNYISIIKFRQGTSRQMELEPSPRPQPPVLVLTSYLVVDFRLSDNSDASRGSALEEEALPSTYKEEHIKDDIELPNCYLLNLHILEGTPISENMRARIRSFLMSQASKQWVMRDTLALACTYIDLYFLRKGFCAVEDFQSLAIGCLIIAMKIQEGKFPTISFNVFNKQDLLSWEKKIAKRLAYQLTPPTYVTFAEHVAVKWDTFTSKPNNFNSHIKHCSNGFNSILRRLYEQLDCAMMILWSLNWPLQALVLNLFYLHARMFNLTRVLQPKILSNEEFLMLFYPNDEFQLFFESFLRYYSQKKTFNLDKELGLYLKNFLSIEPSNRVFAIKQTAEDLRIWDKLQTFPKECYSLCKVIMEKFNSGTKRK